MGVSRRVRVAKTCNELARDGEPVRVIDTVDRFAGVALPFVVDRDRVRTAGEIFSALVMDLRVGPRKRECLVAAGAGIAEERMVGRTAELAYGDKIAPEEEPFDRFDPDAQWHVGNVASPPREAAVTKQKRYEP